MLANLLVKPRILKLREIETPEPDRGEILVRIKAGLTCGTDLKAFMRGHPMIPLPTVFGHEFSGIVEKTGRGVRKLSKGMGIMAVHSAPCRKCRFCREERYNLCENIMETKVLGAFSEYILLPEHIVSRNVYPKPGKLSFQEAAFLEPLSCVLHSINSVRIVRGNTSVIVGAGAIGLLHLMVLKSKGVKTIVIEKKRERIKKALELKADMVINPDRSQPLKKILDFTHHQGADVVFECTGMPEVWEQSVWLVQKGGTVILFGGCKQGTRVTYDAARLHYDEITLKGVFHYNPSDVGQAFQLLRDRKLGVKKLISGEYSLRDLNKAFSMLTSGKGIKYAIIP
jgi:L-iditol 2-dehydrogenase